MPKRNHVPMRPCDCCKGKLVPPYFYRIDVSMALMNMRAMQQHAGLTMMLGGTPEADVLAQVMGPQDEFYECIGDQKEAGGVWTELIVCADCFLMKDLPMAEMVEQWAHRQEETEHENANKR